MAIQNTGTIPPAYNNFVTAARKKKKPAANPFPLASAIKAAAKTAPPLPPLRKPRSPTQDRAIFAKTKGRGR